MSGQSRIRQADLLALRLLGAMARDISMAAIEENRNLRSLVAQLEERGYALHLNVDVKVLIDRDRCPARPPGRTLKLRARLTRGDRSFLQTLGIRT